MFQAMNIGKGIETTPFSHWLGELDSGQIRIGNSFSGTSERSLQLHEHLYMEGDPQTHVYQLQSGVIGLYKLMADGRRQIVGFSFPGDMLGLDHPDQYGNSAEALSPCRVRCIPIAVIDRLMAIDPAFGRSLLRVTSLELNETRDQLLALGRKSAMEKLATFFLQLSRRNARKGQCPQTLHLPMKRADIGDFLGLTIETVSRNITRLKVARVIQLVSNSEVRILDPQSLEFMADGNTCM